MFKALVDRFEAREDREYWRAGVVASTIANFAYGFKPPSKPYQPSQFMPAKPKPKQTTDDMQRVLIELNAAFGGEMMEME
jgi:hypothetical protein